MFNVYCSIVKNYKFKSLKFHGTPYIFNFSLA